MLSHAEAQQTLKSAQNAADASTSGERADANFGLELYGRTAQMYPKEANDLMKRLNLEEEAVVARQRAQASRSGPFKKGEQASETRPTRKNEQADRSGRVDPSKWTGQQPKLTLPTLAE